MNEKLISETRKLAAELEVCTPNQTAKDLMKSKAVILSLCDALEEEIILRCPHCGLAVRKCKLLELPSIITNITLCYGCENEVASWNIE